MWNSHFHRETMGLEGGVYLHHKMTPPPNLVVFEGWSQILPSTKLFRHGFEQSCSAMATQQMEEKVQQHDEVVEWSKTGCRSQSWAHGKAYERVPALICDTCARRIVCAATIWGGYFAHREQNNPPQTFGEQIWDSSFKFHHPPHNFGLRLQVRKTPLPNPSFPYEVDAKCLKSLSVCSIPLI